MPKKAPAGLLAAFLLITLSALAFQKLPSAPHAGAQAQSLAQISSDLAVNSEGADVVILQNFLESKGLLTLPPGVAKGYFGNRTQDALAAYQASQGISPAAGFFGPLTRERVNAELPSMGIAAPASYVPPAQAAAPAAAPASAPASAPSISSDLTVNSEGPEVVALQNFLESQGFLSMPPGVPKGFFGNRTMDAVVAYQASQGLPITGSVDSSTKEKVNSSASAPASQPSSSAMKSSTASKTADAKKDEEKKKAEEKKAEEKKKTDDKKKKSSKSSGGSSGSSNNNNGSNNNDAEDAPSQGDLSVTASLPESCDAPMVSWEKAGNTKYDISRATSATGPFYELEDDYSLPSPYHDYTFDVLDSKYYYRVSGGGKTGISNSLSLEDCYPVPAGTQVSWEGDEDWDEPGDEEELHGNAIWAERGEEVPWMMFAAKKETSPGSGEIYTANVRAIIAPQPSPTEDLIKVPLNEGGEWDGETYVYLYPESSTPPYDDAELEMIPYYGKNEDGEYTSGLQVWAIPDAENEEGKEKKFQYGEEFVVPYLLPGLIEDASESDVGPGTFYPVGLSMDELMEWYWKVKSWKMTASIDYTMDSSTHNSSPEEWTEYQHVGYEGDKVIGPGDNGSNDEGDLPYADDSLNFSTYDPDARQTLARSGSHSYDDGRGEHPTQSWNDSYEVNISPSVQISGPFKKIGDTYYPRLVITSPYWSSENAYAADGDTSNVNTSQPNYEPVYTSWSSFNANIAGHSVPVYYISHTTTGSTAYAMGLNNTSYTVPSSVALEPESYWEYDGRFDGDTGERVDDGPAPISNTASALGAAESGFIQNILAKVKEYVVTGITKVASALGVNEQGTANILTALRLGDNQFAANSGSSRGWKLTNAAVSWFGGCEDVRVDAQGYALRSLKKSNKERLVLNGKTVRFKCGHTWGGIRYLEPTAFSSKLLWTYQTNIEFYAAYPLSESLEPQHRYGNDTLQASCMRLENAKTGQSVLVDIIDRGPNLRLGRKIDMSKAAQAYLGLTDGVSRVNASLVRKSNLNAPCTPPLKRFIRP